MKRFFHAVLMLPLALFAAACSDNDGNEAVKLESGTDTKQQVFADDTAPAPIRFTATAAWTATVTDTTPVQTKAEARSEVDWLTLSAYSGDPGKVSLTINLSPNYTGQDHKAEIRIACGGTSITITVEQKGTTESGEVPEDPEKPGENPDDPTPDNPDQPENPDDKGLLDADGNILFPDAKFAAYMVENFDTDRDGKISVAEAAAINRIECPGMEIESVAGIEYCTELTSLYCGHNGLNILDVSNNTKLTELYCNECQLTALDVSKNTELTYLDCRSNRLTVLDVSKNTELCNLRCSGNQLTTLDVSKNSKLTKLDCSYNQLPALDVSKNSKLTELDCTYNQLTALDVSKNTDLLNLYCSLVQLTTLNVSNNTKLNKLNCSYNQLTTLDIINNTELTDLWCDTNQLTTLNISSNTKLNNLHCSYNQLTVLDISKNTKLIHLGCEFNQLTTLDVNNNTELTSLDCNNNQLTTLDVSMTKLGDPYSASLECNMWTLQTLWLKTGWVLKGINDGARDEKYIHPNTEIKYKN